MVNTDSEIWLASFGSSRRVLPFLKFSDSALNDPHFTLLLQSLTRQIIQRFDCGCFALACSVLAHIRILITKVASNQENVSLTRTSNLMMRNNFVLCTSASYSMCILLCVYRDRPARVVSFHNSMHCKVKHSATYLPLGSVCLLHVGVHLMTVLAV